MPSLDILGTDLASRPEDMSVDFLSNIFGPSFYSITDFVPSGAVKVMFDLFGALNSFALVVLMFTTVFFTASAVIGTAHEGKVLGEKLHSFWVPVRLIGAAAFLVPVKHGLCLFQIILLLTIGVSIQCANKLFEIYIDSTYQETIGSSLPISKTQIAQEIADASLSNLAYLTFFRVHYSDVEGKGDWKTSDGSWETQDTFDPSANMNHIYINFAFSNPRSDPSWLPNGYSELMGNINIDCGYSTGGYTAYQQVCADQSQPIDKAIERISAEVIPAFAAYAKGENMDATIHSKAYQDIVQELARGLEAQAKVMHDSKYNELISFTGEKMTLYKRLGWATAGSVYHTMSNMQAELVKTLQTPITVSKGDHWTNEKFQLNKAEYQRYKKHFLSLTQSYKLPDALQSGDETTFSKLLEKAGMNSNVLIWGIKKIADTDNTMEQFSALGHYLIDTCFIMLGLIALAAMANAGVGVALSTGFLMVNGPMFVAGVLLAYYVPTIPFLIWTAALIGWFIVVIESLVAAPLWVLGISRVDGHEGFFGNGQQGLMLFLGILVRPFAMLLGLCIAITVMTFVDKLLLGMFSLFIVDQDSTTNFTEIPLISTLAYLFILSATRTTFVHKIFGLISYLPDITMQWIGGGAHSLGDKQDEQAVSGIVGQTAGHLAISTNMSAQGVQGIARKHQVKDEQNAYAQKLAEQQKIASGMASKGNESSKF